MRCVFDWVFFLSLGSFASLIVILLIGNWLVDENYELPFWIQSSGFLFGVIFLIGSMVLWVKAIILTFHGNRDSYLRSSGSRLLLVLIGNIYAGYYFHWRDRREFE